MKWFKYLFKPKCKHEWQQMLCPVTLVYRSKMCAKCGKVVYDDR